VNYRGSRDRGETSSGPKLTSVPTLSSLGRPGSPPPELLTCEGTRIAEFFKWHFGALTLPKSANGNLIMLAQELGNLPNKISVEGHTDTKAFANPASTATGNSPPAALTARAGLCRVMALGRTRLRRFEASPITDCTSFRTHSTPPTGASRSSSNTSPRATKRGRPHILRCN